MAPPFLTLAIPTRNRRGLVTRLLSVCLPHLPAGVEVVVSDNASEDGTTEALAGFFHPALTVLNQERDIGMVGNWNACLAQARAEWFLLLSDDDMLDPEFFADAAQATAAAGDADLLIMRCRIIDELTNQRNENPPPLWQAGLVSFAHDLLPAWLRHEFNLPLAGFVFRTEVLRQAGGFAPKLPFAADVATWLPIALRGRTAFWPQARINYILHDGMMTRRFSVRTLLQDMFVVRDLVLDEIGKAGVPPALAEELVGLAGIFMRKHFASTMMFAARAGTSKLTLAAVWRENAGRVPRGGLAILTLAALVVPHRLIPVVGYPYRQGARLARALRTRMVLRETGRGLP